MAGKSLFLWVLLVVFVISIGVTFADCPSADINGDCFIDFDDFAGMANEWMRKWYPIDLAEMASQWLTIEPKGPEGMQWVCIDDPGVDDDADGIPDHESFTGYMSKYELTNAQYCQFLNSALAEGVITIDDGIVYAANDPNHDQPYYTTPSAYPDGPVGTRSGQIVYENGAFTVRTHLAGDPNDPVSYSMANHPVVEVSFYGSVAFCNYYGYRLPTEWEWQAVADFDGTFIYGCGKNINQDKANYWDNGYANPLNLIDFPYTSPAGYYGSFGYGLCDMAGNVWEWTSTPGYGGDRRIKGGPWGYCAEISEVALGFDYSPKTCYYDIGFRPCR